MKLQSTSTTYTTAFSGRSGGGHCLEPGVIANFRRGAAACLSGCIPLC